MAPLNGMAFYLLAEPLFGKFPGFAYLYAGEVAGYYVCFILGRRSFNTRVDPFLLTGSYKLVSP